MMEELNPSLAEVNATLSLMTGTNEARMSSAARELTYAERVMAVQSQMHQTKKGGITKDYFNTYKAMTETPGLDNLFAKNVLTGSVITRYEYDTRKYGFGDIRIPAGTKIDDTQLVRLNRLLNATYIADFGIERVRHAVNESADRFKFNPVLSYLQSVKWDGIARIDTWLIDYARAEDSSYTRAVSAKWLMQCCARAVQPGCHADCVLVLEGKQGIGKNTLMEALLPDCDWGISFSSSSIDKDVITSLEGKWIGEFAEMHTASRADTKLLKAFLSQRIDHYRKPYARDHVSHPRLTVFWSATNETEYLVDETGNRRWWPVAVQGHVALDETLKDESGNTILFLESESVRDLRDQLWAEAYLRFMRGEGYRLTAAETKAAEAEQTDRLVPDLWEAPIADYIAKHTGDGGLAMGDLISSAIGLDTSKQTIGEERRVGKILRKLGYEKRKAREDGRDCKRWYRKR